MSPQHVEQFNFAFDLAILNQPDLDQIVIAAGGQNVGPDQAIVRCWREGAGEKRQEAG